MCAVFYLCVDKSSRLCTKCAQRIIRMCAAFYLFVDRVLAMRPGHSALLAAHLHPAVRVRHGGPLPQCTCGAPPEHRSRPEHGRPREAAAS